MKKYIISIVMILSLLFVTACNNEKKDTEGATEPTTIEITTEQADKDQIRDKKTGVVFGVDKDTKGIQSSSLTDHDSGKIMLDQSTYYFPLVFSQFTGDGWTYFDNQDKQIDDVYDATSGKGSVDIVFRNNGISFIVKHIGFVADPGGFAGESIITDIILQGSGNNETFSWVLPGGITEKSTAADILSVFGDPNNTEYFSSLLKLLLFLLIIST